MSGSHRPQPVTGTTHKGVHIDIERVRDGGWHWRLDQGEWSNEGFFVHADALKAARAAVDASQPPASGKERS